MKISAETVMRAWKLAKVCNSFPPQDFSRQLRQSGFSLAIQTLHSEGLYVAAHSCRSAIMGSTSRARCAGTQHAKRVIKETSAATEM